MPVKARSVTHDHLFSILNSELDVSSSAHTLRVLEIGCGNGQLIAFIWERFCELHPQASIEVYGFDVVDHCIDSRLSFPGGTVSDLRTQFPTPPWEQRIFGGLNGEKWPFPEEYFDAIVSNHVLEHVDDHDFLFAETHRTLKPGGCSVHLFPLKNYIQEGHLKLPLVHRIHNKAFLKSYIKLLSLMGLGQYRSRKGEFASLDEFVNHQVTYMEKFTNYLEKRDLMALAQKNRLSLSFKYTQEFYLTKLRDILNIQRRHNYKTKRSAIVDNFALTTLRYLSSITTFLEKRRVT